MRHSFDPQAKLIILLRRLWGPAGDTLVHLALDTGATSTLINWGVIVFLGYDPALASERVQITTGSGVEFVPRVRLDKIQALGLEHRNFNALCHTLPPSASVDGLLGLDFFHNRRLILDFRNGMITLE